MAVPYEKPIETLENVVQRTDRAHFCGGQIHLFFWNLSVKNLHFNRRNLRQLIFPSDFSFKKEDLRARKKILNFEKLSFNLDPTGDLGGAVLRVCLLHY